MSSSLPSHLLCFTLKNPKKPTPSLLLSNHPHILQQRRENITLKTNTRKKKLTSHTPLHKFPMSNLHKNMKTKFQNTLNLKLILLGFFLLFILFMILRSNSPPPPLSQITTQTQSFPPAQSITTATKTIHSCSKIPPSLVQTILHYTTSNTTPQQTLKEISITSRVLERKSPCNFLVFGLGRDSLMWTALNHGGRTVFLEEDAQWIKTIHAQFPQLEAYHVTYDTRVTQADELLELGRRPECAVVGDVKFSECKLALKELPDLVYETEWDLIMVDAPTGWTPEAPGRMGAIYTAGMVARGKKEGETDVFVHDVDRIVEDKFSKEFLCEGYLKEQEGRLRHFTIPSHKTSLGMSFCP